MPKKGINSHIPKVEIKKEFAPDQDEELLRTLKDRFEKNMNRHKNLEWTKVRERLNANIEKLTSLNGMENTGGEPDIIGYDKKTGEFIFYDCSAETPIGRRNVCYDNEGQSIREKQGVYPAGNAIDVAAAIGIELLTEAQYRELQKLGEFDTKTSSWITTPPEIRKFGGAIFADRRFNHVFIYHNTAATFYGVRGFRGCLRV